MRISTVEELSKVPYYALTPELGQPIIMVHGRTIPEAWMHACIALQKYGLPIHTSFDHEGDPKGEDARVTIVIERPLEEPRISLPGLPGSVEALEHYRLEVMHGVHDIWLNRFSSEKWNYSYYERLFRYAALNPAVAPEIHRIIEEQTANAKAEKIAKYEDEGVRRAKVIFDQTGILDQAFINPVNQIEKVIQLMIEAKDFFRRRFSVSTWIPNLDPWILDPPCLQRITFRLTPGEKEGELVLNMDTEWRSRDLFKAVFMNVYAITDLMRWVAKRIQEGRGCKIHIGRYTDTSNSLHFYGSYATEYPEYIEAFQKRDLTQMTWTTQSVADSIQSAKHILAGQLEYERLTGTKAALPTNESDPHYAITKAVNAGTYPYPPEWDD